MKMVYLKNLTKSRIVIQTLKTSVAPNSVSVGLTQDEVALNKEIQSYINHEMLEPIEVTAKQAMAIRKRAKENYNKAKSVIDASYLKQVSSPSATPSFIPGVNNSIAPPDAGSIINGGGVGEGQAVNIEEEARRTQAELLKVAQKIEDAKELKKIEASETEDSGEVILGGSEVLVDDKESVVMKPEPVTVDEVKSEYVTPIKDLEDFRSSKYYAKKAKISKIDNVQFLKDIINYEHNKTIRALCKQRIEELESK